MAALVISPPAAFAFLAWWIDGSDRPIKADAIVVLGGLPSRPLYAADLYAQGFAPKLWLSRPYRRPDEAHLERLGIHYRFEEELNREILLKKGVPPAAIELYGSGVVSTYEEALAFGRVFETTGKTLLIVTSPWHTRRARIIFRNALPKARIIAVGSSYENFRRLWWKDQILARNVVSEAIKIAYYACGGRMVAGLDKN